MAEFDRSWMRHGIVLIVSFKVVGLVLLFDPLSASAFDATKSSFSLATTCMLLSFIALVVLRYGHEALVRTRLHLCVAAFVLASLVAAVFAQDPYIAVFGAQRRLGLTFLMDMVVLYLAVALAYRTRRDWAILGGAIAGAGLLAIGYGLVQYLGLDPIPWADDVRRRPPSTFGNPDKFGHFLGSTLVAAASLAVLRVSLPRGVRALAAVYAAAALVMEALIATRGAVLSIAVGLPVLGLIFLRLSPVRVGRRVALGVAGAVLGLAVLTAAALGATPLGERIRGGLADGATQQRAYIAQAALKAFLDRPLIGHGPDNFGVVYPRYRPEESLSLGILVSQDSAHSVILQTAATTGLLGALALATVAIGSLLALWRGIPTLPAIAAPLLAGGLAYWANGIVAIGSVSVDWIGWLVAGGAATFGRRVPLMRRRKFSPIVAAVPVLAAAALVLYGLPAYQANRELYVARVATPPERAIPPAERAVSLDPARAEHWFALGRAHQARESLGEAAQAYRQATARAPYVSGYWTTLALTLANLALKGDNSLGGKDAAVDAARRGIAADPNYPTPYHVYALILNGFGDHSAALEASAVAIRLYKKESEYEALAADAAIRMQDASAARTALEMIVQQKDAPVLRVAMARISLKLNDRDGAVRNLRRALELDPQNVPARELMQQMGVP